MRAHEVRLPSCRRTAERLLLRAAGANPRRLVPGSVRLDGYALDWTESVPRLGPVARCAIVDGLTVLALLADDLAAAPSGEQRKEGQR